MRNRVVATLAVMLLVAGMASAQRGRGGPGMGMGRGGGGQCGLGLGLGLGPNVMGQLQLTSDQVAKLQTITNQFTSGTQPLRAQLQTRLKELAVLWTADRPNRRAIESKIAEVDRVRAQIRNAMIDRTFTAMGVLTQAQKARLREQVKTSPGFGVSMGYGLGLGCGMNGGGCYLMTGQ